MVALNRYGGVAMRMWVKQNGVALLAITAMGYVCITQGALAIADAARPVIALTQGRYNIALNIGSDADTLSPYANGLYRVSPHPSSPEETGTRYTASLDVGGSFLGFSNHGYGR